MSQYNTDEIIEASLKNVEALNKKINNLEELHNQIKQSIAESAKLPEMFKNLGTDLNNTSEKYLSGNNEIFKERITEIIHKTAELSVEIERLEKVDFTIPFKELESKFLESSKIQFDKEFSKLDEKTNKLKTINDDLKSEVNRLSIIDLVAHFEKHQNKLSEIFGAINGINAILTTLSQNVIKITNSLGEIDTLIRNYHKTLVQGIIDIQNSSNENQKKTETKLIEIEKTAQSNFNSIQNQLLLNAKKNQTNTYITWGLIVIGIIAIILTCKN